MEKTNLINLDRQVPQDHLHIRGENGNGATANMIKQGSPPHTWRKPELVSVSQVAFRITSTYVEKTLGAMLLNMLLEDHLHIRGENFSRSTSSK